jgi:DNA-binding transcriptional LysR family regulator
VSRSFGERRAGWSSPTTGASSCSARRRTWKGSRRRSPAPRIDASSRADFIARRLWRGQLGLFASREFAKHVLGARKTVSREVLEREPSVVLRATATWRFRDASGAVVEVAPHVRFAVNDPRAAVEVARQGLGFVLAPLDAVADRSGLVPVSTDVGAPEPLDLYLVYPTRRLLPLRVRMAIDWLFDPRYGPRDSSVRRPHA